LKFVWHAATPTARCALVHFAKENQNKIEERARLVLDISLVLSFDPFNFVLGLALLVVLIKWLRWEKKQ